MNQKRLPLAELAKSLNQDLRRLQDVLKKLNLELTRLNLEYKWTLENRKNQS